MKWIREFLEIIEEYWSTIMLVISWIIMGIYLFKN